MYHRERSGLKKARGRAKQRGRILTGIQALAMCLLIGSGCAGMQTVRPSAPLLNVGDPLLNPGGRYLGYAETPQVSGEPILIMEHWDTDDNGLPDRIVYRSPCPPGVPFAVFDARAGRLYLDRNGDGHIEAIVPSPEGAASIAPHIPTCTGSRF
ncbi:MAG: hypothetical protein OEW39_09920 [Deltaproteobacteria bacterium]|nr:hypothetical protein [Deltaproteobacteria bacterium]